MSRNKFSSLLIFNFFPNINSKVSSGEMNVAIRCKTILTVLFGLFCSAVNAQDVPAEFAAELIPGSRFLWELVKIKDKDMSSEMEINDYFADRTVAARIGGRVRLTEESLQAAKVILRKLRACGEFSPWSREILIVCQKPVASEIGNQYIIYRLHTDEGDAVFLKVHTKGNPSLIIDEVEEVKPDFCKNLKVKWIVKIEDDCASQQK